MDVTCDNSKEEKITSYAKNHKKIGRVRLPVSVVKCIPNLLFVFIIQVISRVPVQKKNDLPIFTPNSFSVFAIVRL